MEQITIRPRYPERRQVCIKANYYICLYDIGVLNPEAKILVILTVEIAPAICTFSHTTCPL